MDANHDLTYSLTSINGVGCGDINIVWTESNNFLQIFYEASDGARYVSGYFIKSNTAGASNYSVGTSDMQIFNYNVPSNGSSRIVTGAFKAYGGITIDICVTSSEGSVYPFEIKLMKDNHDADGTYTTSQDFGIYISALR